MVREMIEHWPDKPGFVSLDAHVQPLGAGREEFEMRGETEFAVYARRDTRPVAQRQLPVNTFQVQEQHAGVGFFGETASERAGDELVWNAI
jgi:hypothetical protein